MNKSGVNSNNDSKQQIMLERFTDRRNGGGYVIRRSGSTAINVVYVDVVQVMGW